MKNIVQQTVYSRLNKDEALRYIQDVYEEPTTSFDESCIGSVIVDYPYGTKPRARVEYVSIKVTTKDGHTCYWPIKPYSEEIEHLVAFKFVQKKIEGTTLCL